MVSVVFTLSRCRLRIARLLPLAHKVTIRLSARLVTTRYDRVIAVAIIIVNMEGVFAMNAVSIGNMNMKTKVST